MSFVVYILASLLALVYAIVAWRLYPHFISIKYRIVKSNAQLYWGRFAASWLIFALVVIMIPLNWHDFDAQVHSFVGGNGYSETEPNPSPTEETSANSAKVSKSAEQVAAPETSRPLEDGSTSERSQTVSSQIPSPEVAPQQVSEPRAEPTAAQEIATPDSRGTFAPSFDCAKALTGSERLICSNQQLSLLDVQLTQAYRRAMSRTPDKHALKAALIAWRKNQRDACSTAACMASAYKAQIQSLEVMNP